MKIALVYIHVSGSKYDFAFASRFAGTLMAYPPGADHHLIVIVNGKPSSPISISLFQAIAEVVERPGNEGWDIGAYQEAARTVAAGFDLMVCLGESCYFTRPGWLKRLADVAETHGAGMYGVASSNSVNPHLNTTAFAVSPGLLGLWPKRVKTKQERYEFEHGRNAFWRAVARKHTVRLVTWGVDYAPKDWRTPRNGFWRGDQSDCLLRFKRMDDWDTARPASRREWTRRADTVFA